MAKINVDLYAPYSNGVNATVFAEIFDLLPPDAIVAGIDQKGTIGVITIESQSFKDTLIPMNYPEIIVHLKLDSAGKTCVERLDMSAALDAFALSGSVPLPSGSPYAPGPQSNIPSSLPDFDLFGYADKNGSSATPDNPQPIHQHRWETYHGLSETFEYCAKCGERKK